MNPSTTAPATPATFSEHMTLGDARSRLRSLVDDGARCPLCRQFAKVYRRPLHASMARALVAIYRAQGLEYGVPGDYLDRPAFTNAALLRHWALLEPEAGQRDDGSRRTGRWRVTALGAEFVRGEATVPKYARVYNGRCLGLEGEALTIAGALGEPFDYSALMRQDTLERVAPAPVTVGHAEAGAPADADEDARLFDPPAPSPGAPSAIVGPDA